MYNVLLLSNNSDGAVALLDGMARSGLAYQVATELPLLEETAGVVSPQAVLVDLASLGHAQARQLIEQCKKLKLPVLLVVPQERLSEYDPSLNPDDFVLSPVRRDELLARLKQAVYRVNGPSGPGVLKVGDLVIDLERYDVVVAGRRVTLTYKEFQLLVLLASNPGRVYTREALLSQVWGYDYLGGTRTVDVHVRRLRSKIESPGQYYIETVRVVGYRFKPQP